MLDGLWVKISALLASAFGITAFILSLVWKSGKRKDDIIDGHEKKDEIIDDMNDAEIKAEEVEKDAKDKISPSNWRDSI